MVFSGPAILDERRADSGAEVQDTAGIGDEFPEIAIERMGGRRATRSGRKQRQGECAREQRQPEARRKHTISTPLLNLSLIPPATDRRSTIGNCSLYTVPGWEGRNRLADYSTP